MCCSTIFAMSEMKALWCMDLASNEIDRCILRYQIITSSIIITILSFIFLVICVVTGCFCIIRIKDCCKSLLQHRRQRQRQRQMTQRHETLIPLTTQTFDPPPAYAA
jgi:hypothetical protein